MAGPTLWCKDVSVTWNHLLKKCVELLLTHSHLALLIDKADAVWIYQHLLLVDKIRMVHGLDGSLLIRHHLDMAVHIVTLSCPDLLALIPQTCSGLVNQPVNALCLPLETCLVARLCFVEIGGGGGGFLGLSWVDLVQVESAEGAFVMLVLIVPRVLIRLGLLDLLLALVLSTVCIVVLSRVGASAISLEREVLLAGGTGAPAAMAIDHLALVDCSVGPV